MAASSFIKILAPLRGVTIRTFRRVFAPAIAESGFTEAITPFVSAMPGVDPLKDREVSGFEPGVTVQFIGKDPAALEYCLERIKSIGYRTADLNCGCPFPMVRNKGRGSGLLRTPDVLGRMLESGCRVMGPGNFSVKARLGVDQNDELLRLMPLLNSFPLRFLTVHPRTAKAMYEGECDMAAFDRIREAATIPLICNGPGGQMIGRPFVRSLGERADIMELLARYVEESRAELCGEKPVLGRLKELLSYWREIPYWSRRWNLVKISRSLAELKLALA